MTKLTFAEIEAEYKRTSAIHTDALEDLETRYFGVTGGHQPSSKPRITSAEEYASLVAAEEARREAEVEDLVAQYS